MKTPHEWVRQYNSKMSCYEFIRLIQIEAIDATCQEIFNHAELFEIDGIAIDIDKNSLESIKEKLKKKLT